MTTPDISEEVSILEYADWPASKAYALGLNGLYLNLKGREKQGAVSSATGAACSRSSRPGWKPSSTPRTGKKRSPAHTYPRTTFEDFIGRAPDIILASTAVTASATNRPWHAQPRDGQRQHGWWSGDHCVDPGSPGTSSPISRSRSRCDMQDVAPPFKIFRHRHAGADDRKALI